ncbi:hypothetical protein F0248_08905 [Vibrio crassostreae]|uniref:hypothetical protein n=1 Tax=Vibrio crassostreae TaxID=246167 RepID=UPI00148C5614|nr:hypothetical protein [Vibrio crassostreae]NOI53201.1 hypothetical protein [Vibrio crassostreae]
MSSIWTEYKDIFPVITFALGYVLNEVIGAVKSRVNLRKIRKVLDYEVNRNLEMLAMTLEKMSQQEEAEEIHLFNMAKIIARTSESMTLNVFDTHISDLSKMRNNEMDHYFSFYSAVSTLKLHSNELIKYVQIEKRSEAQSKQMLARVVAVTTLAKTMLKRRSAKS